MANSIKGITVEIGGDTTGLSKALSGVNSSIKTTQSNLKSVEKLLKLDPSNTELVEQKQKLLASAISDTSSKLTTLKTASEQAEKSLAMGDISQEQYDALQRELIETQQDLEALISASAEANTSLSALSDLGSSLESVGETIADVGTTLTTTVTAGVVALGTAAVTTASSFESAMSQVQATMGITADDLSELDGETVNTMEALGNLAKEMGSTTAFSASECAEALNYLALAGYDTQQMADTLPTVLNLAAAGSMSLSTASDMVTDAMCALGLETSDADAFVDQMAKTASTTNTSVSQLGEGILTIGATAKSMAGGTQELCTALGILANNGIKGSEGGTHLRNVMLSLQSPTDEASGLMEELGLSIYDSEGNMRSLNAILSDLTTSMEGMTSAEQDSVLSTLFNKTDLASVNALLASTGDTWETLQETVSESEGSAQQMADTLLDNLSGQLTILQSGIEGIATAFGEVLLPYIKSAVDVVQDVVDRLSAMDDETRNLIVTIAAIAAAIGPCLVVFGTVLSKVGVAMQAISKLGKSVLTLVGNFKQGTGIFAKISTALGSVSASMVAIVAIVAVLIAAFVTLWNKNEAFRETITATWNSIVEIVKTFIEEITSRFSSLGGSFGDLGDTIEALKEVWFSFCDLLAPVLSGAFSLIATILDTAFAVLLGLFDVFSGCITGDWETLWNGVKEVFSGIWDGLLSLFSTVLKTLQDMVDVILSWFGTSWEEVWTGVKTFFQSIWNKIVSVFTSVLSKIKTTVTTIFTSITSRIYAIWNKVYQTLSPLLKALQNLFRVIAKAIYTVVVTYFTLIGTCCKNVWSKIVNFLGPILTKIKTKITTIWTAIYQLIQRIVTKIKEKIVSVWTKIRSSLSDGLTRMKTVVSEKFMAMKDNISTCMSSIKDRITSVISNLISQAKTWGTDLIQGLIDGIQTKVSAVADVVNSVADTISSFLHFSRPDRGPLHEYEEWMPDFIEGLAEGIAKSKGSITKAIGDVADTMAVDLTGSLQTNTQGETSATSGNTYIDNSRTIHQTNTSPKALSRLEIYRQTRNALNV